MSVSCLMLKRTAHSVTHPSTSPSFFPRAANSLPSSTPTNRPFFPLTVPMNFTVPYISPGTLTISPTSNSLPSILPDGLLVAPPVKACKLAFLFTAVPALRPGCFSAEPVLPYEGR